MASSRAGRGEACEVLARNPSRIVGVELGVESVGRSHGYESQTLGLVLHGHWLTPGGENPSLYNQCGTELTMISRSVSPQETVITALIDHPRAVTHFTVVVRPAVPAPTIP